MRCIKDKRYGCIQDECDSYLKCRNNLATKLVNPRVGREVQMSNERECPNCTTEDWDENGCYHCNAPYVGHGRNEHTSELSAELVCVLEKGNQAIDAENLDELIIYCKEKKRLGMNFTGCIRLASEYEEAILTLSSARDSLVPKIDEMMNKIKAI